MKKLIGTAVLAGLLATSAFAEVNFGAFLRTLFVPVAGDGTDIKSGMVNSWGYGARVARINIDAVSENENFGFSMGVFNDAWGGIAENGDTAVMWVKPWDFLKVSFGKWDYTTFRGDLVLPSFGWVRPANWLFDDEGLTFDKLGAKTGLQLELAPVEGLLIMWNLPLASAKWQDAYKMFEGQDIAAKYTIGDIGTIKLGWGGKGARAVDEKGTELGDDDIAIGDDSYWDGTKVAKIEKDTYTDDKYLGDINVAFDLTAVENLFLTVGAKVSIASSKYKNLYYMNSSDEFNPMDPTTYKASNLGAFGLLKIALGASYQITDNLKVSASYGIQTYAKYDEDGMTGKKKPDHQFGVGVEVGLTDALFLDADFRGLIRGGYEVDMGGLTIDIDAGDPAFSFLLGLRYEFASNGSLGIGFQGTTNGCGFLSGGGDSALGASKTDSFCWAVPIRMQVIF